MTTTEKNLACWLPAPGRPFDIREAPFPHPGPGEVVIRVHTVACNPVDAIRQSLGMMIPDNTFPWIIGTDAAGTIHSVGDGVTNFTPGDRIIAKSDEWSNHKKECSAYQQYFVHPAKNLCKIPDGLSFEDGVVLPLTFETAAGALFEKESMDLSWPQLNGSELQRKQKEEHAKDVVVVFGGSSSVGLCAIQMLVFAGYHVVGLSSTHNFELLKEAGAEAAFDYKKDTCVDEVVQWAKERGLNCAGVLASVIDQTGKSYEQSAAVARQLPGRKVVGTTLARGAMPLPELGDDLRVTACMAIAQDDLAQYAWGQWLPQALATGEMKCLPPPEIVGQGLESVTKGCELIGAGVSGKKIIITGI